MAVDDVLAINSFDKSKHPLVVLVLLARDSHRYMCLHRGKFYNLSRICMGSISNYLFPVFLHYSSYLAVWAAFSQSTEHQPTALSILAHLYCGNIPPSTAMTLLVKYPVLIIQRIVSAISSGVPRRPIGTSKILVSSYCSSRWLQ